MPDLRQDGPPIASTPLRWGAFLRFEPYAWAEYRVEPIENRYPAGTVLPKGTTLVAVCIIHRSDELPEAVGFKPLATKPTKQNPSVGVTNPSDTELERFHTSAKSRALKELGVPSTIPELREWVRYYRDEEPAPASSKAAAPSSTSQPVNAVPGPAGESSTDLRKATAELLAPFDGAFRARVQQILKGNGFEGNMLQPADQAAFEMIRAAVTQTQQEMATEETF